MKKAILITLLACFSVVCMGQNEGALTFLGIPIDGTEAQFTAKLRKKGFTYNSAYECYKGQFNGKSVDVYIHTNHNLVDRVYVAFPYNSEEGIRGEFNKLLSQFKDNGKYVDLSMNTEIPSDEDISHEISVNKKRYQASYSYFNFDRDPLEFMNALIDKFDDFLMPEQIAELKATIKTTMEAPEDEREEIQAKMMAELQQLGLNQSGDENADQEKAFRFLLTFMDGLKSLADGDVWFMIHENYGRYYIGLYYDNLHNQAHGEDL